MPEIRRKFKICHEPAKAPVHAYGTTVRPCLCAHVPNGLDHSTSRDAETAVANRIDELANVRAQLDTTRLALCADDGFLVIPDDHDFPLRIGWESPFDEQPHTRPDVEEVRDACLAAREATPDNEPNACLRFAARVLWRLATGNKLSTDEIESTVFSKQPWPYAASISDALGRHNVSVYTRLVTASHPDEITDLVRNGFLVMLPIGPHRHAHPLFDIETGNDAHISLLTTVADGRTVIIDVNGSSPIDPDILEHFIQDTLHDKFDPTFIFGTTYRSKRKTCSQEREAPTSNMVTH